MAKVDFPASPSNGQQLHANGITYIYNSTKGVWRDVANSINVNSANPPANPEPGQIWFNTASAVLYVYYNDGSSSQWVSVSGPAGPAGAAGSAGASSSPTSYANLAAFPSSGNTAGDFGFATIQKQSMFGMVLNGTGYIQIQTPYRNGQQNHQHPQRWLLTELQQIKLL